MLTSKTRVRADQQDGFVLLELLLVLTILTIVVSLVLPRAHPFDGANELRLSARAIATLLRADRNAARRSGHPVVTEIDLDRGVVRSGDRGGSVSLSRQTRLSVSGASAKGIRFWSDGTAEECEIGLALDRTANASITIRVYGLTGAVLLARDGDAGR